MTGFLSVTGLTRRFGGLVAVNAVDLDLYKGEVHAVIGTNGAGKSTLINMLSGEIEASSGRITLDGEDITQRAQFRRARDGIGRSYQRTTIFRSSPCMRTAGSVPKRPRPDPGRFGNPLRYARQALSPPTKPLPLPGSWRILRA